LPFPLRKIYENIQLISNYLDLLKKRSTDATVSLLNFLSHKGLKVSKNILKFIEEQVRFWEIVSNGRDRLNPESIDEITAMPVTKKEFKRYLGLIRCCRLWIESYALRTKTLYSIVLEKEPAPLIWKRGNSNDRGP
jgi:hypothetical protein